MLKYNIATYRPVCILNITHVYNMLLHMPRAVPNSAVKKRTPKLAPSISPRIPTHLSTLSAILVCLSPKQAVSRFSCIVDQGKVPTLQLLRRSHPWDRTERCSSMKWSEYMSPHQIPKMISVSFDEGDCNALQWSGLKWSGLQWTCAPVQVDCTSGLYQWTRAPVDCTVEKIVVCKCKVIPPTIWRRAQLAHGICLSSPSFWSSWWWRFWTFGMIITGMVKIFIVITDWSMMMVRWGWSWWWWWWQWSKPGSEEPLTQIPGWLTSFN